MILEITPIWLSIASLFIAIIGFIYQRIEVVKKLENRLTKLEQREDTSNRVDKVCERLSALEVKNNLIWNAVEKAMIDILHHPATPRRDELLEKLNTKDITLNELDELKKILEDISIRTEIPKEERIAASLMVARVAQVIYDYSGITSQGIPCL